MPTEILESVGLCNANTTSSRRCLLLSFSNWVENVDIWFAPRWKTYSAEIPA